MKYVNDIRELVGNTPILKLNNISPDKSKYFCKARIFKSGWKHKR